MEDLVPFKIFVYWDPSEKAEVRRFGIEKSMVTKFNHLNAKILEFYPRLREKTYSITWRDEEEDEISISSDDEVLCALQVMQHHDLIKLSVQVADQKDDEIECIVSDVINDSAIPAKSFSKEDSVHPGVVCDGCGASINGFRYKCTSCPDYDLCHKCESAGLHPEHLMLRVPTAVSRTAVKAAIKRSRHIIKAVAGAMSDDCSHKKSRHDRSKSLEKHHRRSRPSWLDTFATYMNEFANLAGDIDLDRNKHTPVSRIDERSDESSNDIAGKAQAVEPQPSTSNAPKVDFSNLKKTIEDTLNEELQQNENVRKIVDHVLDEIRKFVPQPPASNDVSMNTHVNTKNASVNTNNVDTNNASVYTDNDVGAAQYDHGDARFIFEKHCDFSDSHTQSIRDESPDKGDDWTVIGNDTGLTEGFMKNIKAHVAFNLPADFQERVKIREGMASLYPPLHTTAAVLNLKEPERHSAPQPSPTDVVAAPRPARPMVSCTPHTQVRVLLPKQASPAHTTRKTKSISKEPSPTPQTKHANTSSSRHPKAHIQAAIENMLAMGFTNEGDWLTQLLDSKDGNIAAVLDLLTPVNPKKP